MLKAAAFNVVITIRNSRHETHYSSFHDYYTRKVQTQLSRSIFTSLEPCSVHRIQLLHIEIS